MPVPVTPAPKPLPPISGIPPTDGSYNPPPKPPIQVGPGGSGNLVPPIGGNQGGTGGPIIGNQGGTGGPIGGNQGTIGGQVPERTGGQCGYRNSEGVGFRITGNTDGESEYGLCFETNRFLSSQACFNFQANFHGWRRF